MGNETFDKWAITMICIAMGSVCVLSLTLALWLIGGMAGWWEISD